MNLLLISSPSNYSLLFRYAWEDPLLDIVHVNDLCSCESAAYLIKYDSVHGTWDKEVEMAEDGNGFTVDGKLVTFTREKDFTKVDWSGMAVDMVMECTGKFLTVKDLQPYFDECGVKRVVVSAPVKEDGALNVVLGCNHGLLTEELKLVTNGKRLYVDEGAFIINLCIVLYLTNVNHLLIHSFLHHQLPRSRR